MKHAIATHASQDPVTQALYTTVSLLNPEYNILNHTSTETRGQHITAKCELDVELILSKEEFDRFLEGMHSILPATSNMHTLDFAGIKRRRDGKAFMLIIHYTLLHPYPKGYDPKKLVLFR